MAKKPPSRRSRRSGSGGSPQNAASSKTSRQGEDKAALRADAGFAALDDGRLQAQRPQTALVDAARSVISRSRWQKAQQQHLSRQCRDLVAKLRETCPDVVVGRPLKAGEVAGDIAIGTKDFQAMFSAAVGAKETPRKVWSDGTNELLVEIARISVKTTKGLVQAAIPVACNETGPRTILVSFATGTPENPAGLVVATDTVPEGPPEIVEIWGEALTALAWTSVLRLVSTLADSAGRDKDGAGLVPAGLAADDGGVKLLVMARHEMDRVVK